MKGLFHAFDAAYPPLIAPPNCQAVLGYIGGNTPHVWTREEWLRFQHLRQCPIWVAGSSNPVQEGRMAVKAATDLGWTPNASPDHRWIVLDMETSVSASFVNGFADEVKAGGFHTIIYGSRSTVTLNPERSGYWVASWNNVAVVDGVNVVGHQYVNHPDFDMSVFDSSAWSHFGYGPRT